VEMWSVMLPTSFDEHADDNSEEPREFRHGCTLHRPAARSVSWQLSASPLAPFVPVSLDHSAKAPPVFSLSSRFPDGEHARRQFVYSSRDKQHASRRGCKMQ
jgi:hypothetical protein